MLLNGFIIIILLTNCLILVVSSMVLTRLAGKTSKSLSCPRTVLQQSVGRSELYRRKKLKIRNEATTIINTITTTTNKKNSEIFSSDLEKIEPQNSWIDLEISPEELRPSACLTTGQCFSWIAVSLSKQNNEAEIKSSSAWGRHDSKEWVGPIGNKVYSIRETCTTTLCRLLSSSMESPEVIKDLLKDYFQINKASLKKLYNDWSICCPRLSDIAKVIPGVRIIRQDPFECLISFLCSSNNNIPRITSMLSSIRQQYGTKILSSPSLELYSFPRLTDFQNVTEKELRLLGLGYRAKYLVKTIDQLEQLGGEEYLHLLRQKSASDTQSELMQFMGIGRKVADCIALFSLDKINAIPVDIHVWHIACRDYDSTLLDPQVKSLTPTIYNRVQDLFRNKFGPFSGWAHSLLFIAELPSFRPVLPSHILEQMDKFKATEMERKAKKKQIN